MVSSMVSTWWMVPIVPFPSCGARRRRGETGLPPSGLPPATVRGSPLAINWLIAKHLDLLRRSASEKYLVAENHRAGIVPDVDVGRSIRRKSRANLFAPIIYRCVSIPVIPE